MHYYCNTQHFSAKKKLCELFAREWGWGPDISKYHITNIKTVIKPALHLTISQNRLRWHQTSNRNSDWCLWMSNERCHGGILAKLNTKFVPLVINYDGGVRTAHGRGREMAALPRQRNKWIVCLYNSICCCSNMHVLIASHWGNATNSRNICLCLWA